MARRSQLFRKTRSSKATLSKKRKAEEELQQAYKPKRARQSRFPEDEEEIGDFIVVDTGSLYEPEGKGPYSTTDDEHNNVTTSHTSRTPLPSIEVFEEEEAVVTTIPEISNSESNAVQGAVEDLLVLPSAPTGTYEGRSSQELSPEPTGDHIPSGSKDDPIVLSPLPTIDKASPRSPTAGLSSDELDSPIPIPLNTVSEHDAQLPQNSTESQTGFWPSSLPSTPEERLALEVPIIQPCRPGASETCTHVNSQRNEPVPIEISPPRKFGDAPLGVLVTRGDQCPSKFVVSGIVSKSEAGQEVSAQSRSQARNRVTWIETVTESRADMSPERPGPESYQPESSIQAKEASETASKEVPRVSADIFQEKRATDFVALQQQMSLLDNENAIHTGSVRNKLPLPIQYPTSSPETINCSGPDGLDSITKKLMEGWTTKVSCSLDILPRAKSIESASRVDSAISVSTTSTSLQTLRFTSDNRAASTLTTAEVDRLIQIFIRDAVAILPREQVAQGKVYPAGVILWESLQNFHKWYIKEERRETGSKTRSSATRTMKFELLDVHWQPQNVFYLPRRATADEFRDLKQCIWDLFWVSANLNGAENEKSFRILITPASDMVDGANLGHLTTGSSPTRRGLPPIFPRPPSLHSNFENMIQNFQEVEQNNAHHHHRIPNSRPPALTVDSAQVALEVEGNKTRKLLRDFLQKNSNPDNSQPPSTQTSPPRPESHGSSTGLIELLHPPLERPESNIIPPFQPQQSARSSLMPAFPNNTGAPPNLPPLGPFATANVLSPNFQTPSNSSQNKEIRSATQLPTSRPSPAMTNTYQMETPRTQPSISDNSYTANTARPMFSAQPQKDPTTPRTMLPSTQNIRVPNTAQPAPNIQAAPIAIAPRPSQRIDIEKQTETTPTVSQTSRTPREKKRLRDNAMQMIGSRHNLELEDDETTGGRKRTYPEISGVIVDKNSEMGLVVITERGYTIQQVNTGQDVFMDQFTELALREGQACVIHGSSTVLYYKTRNRFAQNSQSPPSRRPLPSQAPLPPVTRPRASDFPTVVSRLPRQEVPTNDKIQPAFSPGRREQLILPAATADIKLRLQKDAAGHFTEPLDFALFTSADCLQNFFHWFAKQTGRGGELGPERLRITLKDAMPVAKTYDLYRVYGEAALVMEKLQKIQDDIVVECERAKRFMPDLKEFGVLVGDPGWMEEVAIDLT